MHSTINSYEQFFIIDDFITFITLRFYVAQSLFSMTAIDIHVSNTRFQYPLSSTEIGGIFFSNPLAIDQRNHSEVSVSSPVQQAR